MSNEELQPQPEDQVTTDGVLTDDAEVADEDAELSFSPEDHEKRPGAERYYEAGGRRKNVTARIRVFTRKSTDTAPENEALITINDKPYREYFTEESLRDVVELPLKKLKSLNRFKATVRISGGGVAGQADAIKFGLSRALVLFDSNFSKKLRKAG